MLRATVLYSCLPVRKLTGWQNSAVQDSTLHTGTGQNPQTTLCSSPYLEDALTQGLREAKAWLADVSLHELHHAGRE